MKFHRYCTVFLAYLSAGISMAHAAISYTVAPLADDRWRYEYTVTNATLPGPVDEFTILFDVNLVGTLLAADGPPGWDLLLIQPDVNLPAAGFLDGLAMAGGINPGDSAVFTVEFIYLASGLPGPQLFTFVDPDTLVTLEIGMTATVPEPASTWLLLSGLGVLLLAHRHIVTGKRDETEVCHV
jgi:hypothetical protein